jgi:hypothetical protein
MSGGLLFVAGFVYGIIVAAISIWASSFDRRHKRERSE